ncbi:MAG TPA: sensor histidine kinase [Oscillatoriaceae cyanobacterium M7585_C2015_266]|nr:sensor histidine kinase [Oscillatoriaceae cyanobacterium M7585_C2015_266]
MFKPRQIPPQRRTGHFFILFFLLMTTVAIGAVALLSYQIVRELILQQLKEKALLKVQKGISEIDRWLAKRKAEVETLANTPTVATLDWEIAGSYLKSEVKRLREYQHFTLAYPDGSYYTTKVDFATGKNILDRLWFQKSLAGELYVSDPLISRTTGVVQVLVSAPIKNLSQSIGVLGGAIKIERVEQVVQSLKQEPNSYAFALNSQGRAIVHPEPKFKGTIEKPAPSLLEVKETNLAALARRMVNKQQGIELTQLNDKWYYIAYAPLKEAEWSIAFAIPRENLESQLEALNSLAVILSGLLVIAILGGWRQMQLFEQTQQQLTLLAQQKEELNQALTELQQRQLQLVQSEKMSSLGQLVAGIAHEINNPISFIYGNLPHVSEYLQNLIQLVNLYKLAFPAIPSEIRDFEHEIDLHFIETDLPQLLASMKAGAERIRKIIFSLRNFSRLDEAERKEVDLHEGIENTLLLLQHKFNSKIQIVKNYGTLPPVECYSSQINQVFMHLLENAIDALLDSLQPDKRVEINTQLVENAKGLNVRIAVKDNGPGIPEQIRAKIFDPFFTTKPIGKGTGLGLAICYQIVVQMHQGHIWVENPISGGSEFIVEFPIRSTAV